MKYLSAIILLLISTASSAAPSFMPLSMQHKKQVEVGTGFGSGNIDYQNVAVNGKITSTGGSYTNELKGKFANIDKRNNDSENIFSVNNKLKYDLSDKNYTFGELEYVSNEAAGIERRTSGSIGLGRNIATKDNLNIAAEASAGARQSNYKPGLEDESSVLGKIGTVMDWQLHEKVNLSNDTFMAFTSDNTQTVSDTSVKTYVYNGMYLKGSLNVENNDKAPAGYKKTDTTTSVNVGYEF